MIEKLRSFGKFGDTWITVFEKMIKEVEESKSIKDRYGLK